MPTWTTPGTYTWVVPAGITELGHVAIYRGALLSAARIAAHHTRGRT